MDDDKWFLNSMRIFLIYGCVVLVGITVIIVIELFFLISLVLGY